MKTFAEMKEVLSQHAKGLVTDGEAILAMQCTKRQIDALLLLSKLPIRVYEKIDITDMEPTDSGPGARRMLRGPLEVRRYSYYRTRVGRIFQVFLAEEEDRPVDALEFRWRNDTGSGNAGFRWNNSGACRAMSQVDSLMLPHDLHMFDFIEEVTPNDFTGQGNVVELQVLARRYYMLQDGDMVYIECDGASFGGDAEPKVVAFGNTVAPNGDSVKETWHGTRHETRSTRNILAEVRKDEYDAWKKTGDLWQ